MKTLRDIALPLGSSPADLRVAAAQAIGVPIDQIADLRVRKVSVDARDKQPKKVYTLDVWLVGDAVAPEPIPALRRPAHVAHAHPGKAPIIVGTGPAGLWAALRFIEAGIAPIVLDRGGAVPLASHPAMYRMAEKHARLDKGGVNPFIDPTGYQRELDLTEAMFQAVLAAQQKLAAKPPPM